MPDDFVIARNPDGDSTLPYLLRIPLGERGVILKARDTWPRTAKIYCHRVDDWPEDAEVVERVPVRSCIRRGASIDLVLDRGRENRSQLVMTTVQGGRQAIFWQSARTTKQARPAGSIPRTRASGLRDIEIVVDSHERYPYAFGDQQATTRKAALTAGDYGVLRDDALVATVERKSLADLVSSLTSGKLRYQLAELAVVPRAAVVVDDRYSQVLALKHVRPAVVLEGLAECQVRWPQVPIHFCETRKLAQEWTYRFLAAAWVAAAEEGHGVAAVADLADAPRLAPAPATSAEVRAWAALHGVVVSDRGRIPRAVREAYDAAQGTDLEDARVRLQAEHRRTTRRLASLRGDYDEVVAASRDTNADDEHDPEGATIAFERSQIDTVVRLAEHSLSEVDAALARLDDATYGVCEVCGRDVDPARLEVRPTARTCVSCA